MRSSGKTRLTPPSLMASAAIPNTTQESSSCARLTAPTCFISSMPLAPSSPIPVMITPTTFWPAKRAAERNRTSTLGRCRLTSGPSLIST